MQNLKTKLYFRALKLIFTGTDHPLSALFVLALKSPPYHITLKSSERVESKDRLSLFKKIMESYIYRNSSLFYAWNFNGKEYRIAEFNSPATIYSTFVYEDWKRLNVRDKSVLDIGGYVGDTAIYFIARGAKRIVVYEAFPYSYNIALKNITQNNLNERIEINNCAVGGSDSYMTIDPNYVNNNESRATSQSKGTDISVFSLRTIVEKYDIDGWALKMNCEGCEYDVFQNTGADVFQKFSEIYIHYHGDPQPLVHKLRDSGFKVKVSDYIYATKKRKSSAV